MNDNQENLRLERSGQKNEQRPGIQFVQVLGMTTESILGVNIHDAISGVMRAVERGRLQVNGPMTIRALGKVAFGPDGRIDPATVGPEVRALATAYIASHPGDWATR